MRLKKIVIFIIFFVPSLIEYSAHSLGLFTDAISCYLEDLGIKEFFFTNWYKLGSLLIALLGLYVAWKSYLLNREKYEQGI